LSSKDSVIVIKKKIMYLVEDSFVVKEDLYSVIKMMNPSSLTLVAFVAIASSRLVLIGSGTGIRRLNSILNI
jgi:hypothetical protein